LCPLLEDLWRITESIRILVPVDRMKQKMFSNHDETSPSIASVSAPSVACFILAVQQQEKLCRQFVDVLLYFYICVKNSCTNVSVSKNFPGVLQCPFSISSAWTFISVCNQPPRPTQLFIPPESVNWVPASAGKAKTGMVHSASGWMRGVQVKLWDLVRTRAIPERLRTKVCSRRGAIRINVYLYLYLYRREATSGIDPLLTLEGIFTFPTSPYALSSLLSLSLPLPSRLAVSIPPHGLQSGLPYGQGPGGALKFPQRVRTPSPTAKSILVHFSSKFPHSMQPVTDCLAAETQIIIPFLEKTKLLAPPSAQTWGDVSTLLNGLTPVEATKRPGCRDFHALKPYEHRIIWACCSHTTCFVSCVKAFNHFTSVYTPRAFTL